MITFLIVSLVSYSLAYQIFVVSLLIPIAAYLIFIGAWFQNKALQTLGRMTNLLGCFVQAVYTLSYFASSRDFEING